MKKMRYRKTIGLLLLTFSLLAGGVLATGGSPLVKAELDKSALTVGEIVTFRILVESRPGLKVTFPALEGEFSGLEVLGQGPGEPRQEEGRKFLTHWYKLRAQDVGSYTIPSLQLAYTIAGQPQERPLQTKALALLVKSVIPEGEQLQDIIDIKPLEPVGVNYRFWIVISLMLLVAGLAGWYLLYRRKRQKQPRRPEQMKRPAHETALSRLRQLQERDCAGPEQVKRLYFTLSEIFRSYLEQRYQFPASDWTSEEIIAYLNKNGELSFALKSQAREFLENTDLVKFAELLPSPEQIRAEIQRAIDFVQASKPRPAATGAGGAEIGEGI